MVLRDLPKNISGLQRCIVWQQRSQTTSVTSVRVRKLPKDIGNFVASQFSVSDPRYFSGKSRRETDLPEEGRQLCCRKIKRFLPDLIVGKIRWSIWWTIELSRLGGLSRGAAVTYGRVRIATCRLFGVQPDYSELINALFSGNKIAGLFFGFIPPHFLQCWNI